MDELALVRQELDTARDQIKLLQQTLVVKDVEVEICKCGVPHTLYVLGKLNDKVTPT